MGKAQKPKGCVLCQVPQEADFKVEFSIKKCIWISPCGGVKEVGLGRGSYQATIESQKNV